MWFLILIFASLMATLIIYSMLIIVADHDENCRNLKTPERLYKGRSMPQKGRWSHGQQNRRSQAS